jgi:hypothetical protein
MHPQLMVAEHLIVFIRTHDALSREFKVAGAVEDMT